MVGYYQEFIPNFAAVAAPLTDLLRKDQREKVVWLEAQERAYVSLKKAVTSKPILHLPDFGKEFILSTDASDRGLGCAPMQQHGDKLYPIAYASRKLNPREEKYSVSERECLGIIWAIKKFYLYLYGKEFVLQTDHKSLEYLNSAKFNSAKIMRWSLYLQAFKYRVQYIRSRDNACSDFLSRVH